MSKAFGGKPSPIRGNAGFDFLDLMSFATLLPKGFFENEIRSSNIKVSNRKRTRSQL